MNQQVEGSILSRQQQMMVLESLGRLIMHKYVVANVATQAADEILSHMTRGDYDLPPAEFADAVTRDLQDITADHHLRVVYDPDRIDRMRNPGTQDNQALPKELARLNNHGFEQIKRLKGNIGYVDIRHFFPPEISGHSAAAAMRLIADSDAVIIDLRNNTGGNPGMVQFLCSYFIGGSKPVHLNSITSRPQGTTTEYWTIPEVPGKRMPDLDLTILTSSHTFSGGEEFAYNLKHLNRAKLIGETTAGGANPAGIDIIDENFYVTIPHATPINPVTGTNWEGGGVKPHVEVHATKALRIAHTQALSRLIDAASDEVAKKKLQWLLEEVVSCYCPLTLTASMLERHVGRYGDSGVSLEDDTLIYHRRFFRYRLIPLTETTFWLDGPVAGFESRLDFVSDESGAVSQIVGRFPDGRSVMKKRLSAGQ